MSVAYLWGGGPAALSLWPKENMMVRRLTAVAVAAMLLPTVAAAEADINADLLKIEATTMVSTEVGFGPQAGWVTVQIGDGIYLMPIFHLPVKPMADMKPFVVNNGARDKNTAEMKPLVVNNGTRDKNTTTMKPLVVNNDARDKKTVDMKPFVVNN
jgi:hypothetical protein